MTERTKKILFAVFFVTFSVGMGYLLFVLFFQARLPILPTTETPTDQLGSELPSAGEGVPTSTTDSGAPGARIPEPGLIPGTGDASGLPQAASRVRLLQDSITRAVSPTSDGRGARFYNPEDGRFYKANDDGTVALLGDKQFFNVQNVGWGKQGEHAVLEFPDGTNVYYNFTEQRQVTLPKHWTEFQFSYDDSKVASKSIGVDPENRFLITSKPDGTEARALEALGDNGDLAHIDWSPSGQIVGYSFTGEPQGGDLQQEVLFIGKNHENFASLIAPGADFLPLWSKTGKQILFSTWNADSRGKPNLWVASSEPSTIGAGRKNINVQTWADKCAWADETVVYCGVPQGLPDNAGLQREDYDTLPDDVYRIDLKSGISQKISTSDQLYPISNPVINRDKTKLIFADAASGKLYSYDIN